MPRAGQRCGYPSGSLLAYGGTGHPRIRAALPGALLPRWAAVSRTDVSALAAHGSSLAGQVRWPRWGSGEQEGEPRRLWGGVPPRVPPLTGRRPVALLCWLSFHPSKVTAGATSVFVRRAAAH